MNLLLEIFIDCSLSKCAVTNSYIFCVPHFCDKLICIMQLSQNEDNIHSYWFIKLCMITLIIIIKKNTEQLLRRIKECTCKLKIQVAHIYHEFIENAWFIYVYLPTINSSSDLKVMVKKVSEILVSVLLFQWFNYS